MVSVGSLGLLFSTDWLPFLLQFISFFQFSKSDLDSREGKSDRRNCFRLGGEQKSRYVQNTGLQFRRRLGLGKYLLLFSASDQNQSVDNWVIIFEQPIMNHCTIINVCVPQLKRIRSRRSLGSGFIKFRLFAERPPGNSHYDNCIEFKLETNLADSR